MSAKLLVSMDILSPPDTDSTKVTARMSKAPVESVTHTYLRYSISVTVLGLSTTKDRFVLVEVMDKKSRRLLAQKTLPRPLR